MIQLDRSEPFVDAVFRVADNQPGALERAVKMLFLIEAEARVTIVTTMKKHLACLMLPKSKTTHPPCGRYYPKILISPVIIFGCRIGMHSTNFTDLTAPRGGFSISPTSC